MSQNSSKPVGVFDSGVGGLSVLSALTKIMPNENFIYVGDTARVPYGNKPPELVKNFTWEVANFLITKDVKAIVIACNSASAIALPELNNKLNIPIYGVVHPTVDYTASNWQNIGIIATAATIHSKAYQKPLLEAGKQVWAKDCPMLVPLVEEGVWGEEIATVVVEHYLEHAPHNLQALILACTHYPFLKDAINKAVPDLELVDCAEVTAKHVKSDLAKNNLLVNVASTAASTASTAGATDAIGATHTASAASTVEYMVSGDATSFHHIASKLGLSIKNITRVQF